MTHYYNGDIMYINYILIEDWSPRFKEILNLIKDSTIDDIPEGMIVYSNKIVLSDSNLIEQLLK